MQFVICQSAFGSTHCYNCKAKDKCPYDAYKIYITNENGIQNGNTDWPVNIIMENVVIKKENI